MTRQSGASWMGTGKPSERPLPSWLAPAPPPGALAMRWSTRPSQGPERWSNPPAVADISYNPAPRIEIPESDHDLIHFPAPAAVPSIAPKEGTHELEVLLADLRSVIQRAQTDTVALRREALETSERDLVRLAVAIATRVVGREVQIDPTLLAAWAREGIAALACEDRVVIALPPEVAEALEAGSSRAGLEDLADVVTDHRLKRDECEVRGKFGRIDESARARLDAVVASLDLDDEDEESAE